jgi:hypothetical protein
MKQLYELAENKTENMIKIKNLEMSYYDWLKAAFK